MLVGGKGTRLRPLTLSAPKPLLPTAGVPFLAHQLARAAECGITHVVLATSYRAEMFTEAFGTGARVRAVDRLRLRVRAARHRRRHPQRGRAAARRPRRPGRRAERRHPVRARPSRAGGPAPEEGSGGDAAPGPGG